MISTNCSNESCTQHEQMSNNTQILKTNYIAYYKQIKKLINLIIAFVSNDNVTADDYKEFVHTVVELLDFIIQDFVSNKVHFWSLQQSNVKNDCQLIVNRLQEIRDKIHKESKVVFENNDTSGTNDYKTLLKQLLTVVSNTVDEEKTETNCTQ